MKPFALFMPPPAAPEPSPTSVAAATLRKLPHTVGACLVSAVTTIAQNASAHGLTPILAEMTDEEAQAFREMIGATQTYWEALSPHPFPVILEQPLPPPEPTEPEVPA